MIYINHFLFAKKYMKYLIGYYKMEGRIEPGFNDSVQDFVLPYCNLQASTNINFGTVKYNNGAITDVLSGNARLVNATTSEISKYSFTDGTNDLAFSFSIWLYIKGMGASYGYLTGKNALGTGAQASNAEYGIWIDTSNRIVYRKYSNGLHANSKTYTSTAISRDTLLHIGISDDALGNVLIVVNGVSLTLTVTTAGTGFLNFKTTSLSSFTIFNTAVAAAGTALYAKVDDLGIFKGYAMSVEDFQKIYLSNKELK